MPPATMEEKASRFCGMAGAGQRIGMSELARGKSWRSDLAAAGCVEVTDRSDTVGLLMTPDYAKDLSEYIRQLESELEQAHIEMLFELRKNYSKPTSGKQLADAALAEFDAREDRIREFLDGGE